jgi:hypothetical protein
VSFNVLLHKIPESISNKISKEHYLISEKSPASTGFLLLLLYFEKGKGGT